MSNYPASDRQLSFIKSLVEERSETVAVPDVEAFVSVLRDERITGTGASALIEKLLKTAKNAPKPVVVASTPGQTVVRNGEPTNRYGGQCVLCGGQVSAGEGTYRRGARGGWETLHLPNGCPQVTTTVIAQDGKDCASWKTATAAVAELEPGYYAVPSINGTNDLTFFAVKVNKGMYNPAKKGEKYLRHVVGGKNEDELKISPAFILKAVEAAKTLGVEESQALFGREIGRCGKCGRTLTDETSRAYGIGPDCRGAR